MLLVTVLKYNAWLRQCDMQRSLSVWNSWWESYKCMCKSKTLHNVFAILYYLWVSTVYCCPSGALDIRIACLLTDSISCLLSMVISGYSEFWELILCICCGRPNDLFALWVFTSIIHRHMMLLILQLTCWTVVCFCCWSASRVSKYWFKCKATSVTFNILATKSTFHCTIFDMLLLRC